MQFICMRNSRLDKDINELEEMKSTLTCWMRYRDKKYFPRMLIRSIIRTERCNIIAFNYDKLFPVYINEY